MSRWWVEAYRWVGIETFVRGPLLVIHLKSILSEREHSAAWARKCHSLLSLLRKSSLNSIIHQSFPALWFVIHDCVMYFILYFHAVWKLEGTNVKINQFWLSVHGTNMFFEYYFAVIPHHAAAWPRSCLCSSFIPWNTDLKTPVIQAMTVSSSPK